MRRRRRQARSEKTPTAIAPAATPTAEPRSSPTSLAIPATMSPGPTPLNAPSKRHRSGGRALSAFFIGHNTHGMAAGSLVNWFSFTSPTYRARLPGTAAHVG